jgi:hypothetical protein
MPKKNVALEVLSTPAVEAEPAPVPAKTQQKPKQDKPYTKVMVYIPPQVQRKFKEIAFTHDKKANDIYVEAINSYLKAHGYGDISSVVHAGKSRKRA